MCFFSVSSYFGSWFYLHHKFFFCAQMRRSIFRVQISREYEFCRPANPVLFTYDYLFIFWVTGEYIICRLSFNYLNNQFITLKAISAKHIFWTTYLAYWLMACILEMTCSIFGTDSNFSDNFRRISQSLQVYAMMMP